MDRTRLRWIDDTFDADEVHFPDETVWKIGRKLSEAFQQRYPPCEASGIYQYPIDGSRCWGGSDYQSANAVGDTRSPACLDRLNTF